jgi:Nuclease-related domain
VSLAYACHQAKAAVLMRVLAAGSARVIQDCNQHLFVRVAWHARKESNGNTAQDKALEVLRAQSWNGISSIGGVERDIKARNVAGSSTRVMASGRRSFRRRLAYSSLLLVAVIFCVNLTNLRSRSLWVSACCIAGILVIARGIIPIIDFFQKRESHAIRGAQAEETVGAVLNLLSDEHMVLHDVPGPCGNIDHVILRKDGAVFVIETKSAPGNVSERNGQLLINGKAPEKDFIRQTLRNVVWVRDILAAELGAIPWVDGALVFTRAYVSIRCDIEQIRVMNVRFLQEWMARAPRKNEIARRAGPKWEKITRLLQASARKAEAQPRWG